MSDDSYKTIREPLSLELKEKGSRFICHVFPVKSREEAEATVAAIARKYHDATHNCFAYCVGEGARVTRFSDDGEPAGTAGKPILNAIVQHELTNIAVVVTRYFGGTKLGAGGLVRAYGGVTVDALSHAVIETIYIQDTMKLTCSYHQLKPVLSLVDKYSGQIVESDYSDSVHLIIRLRKKFSEQFVRRTIDVTAGQVKPIRVT
ncbi:YigZ family protein [candidate division KSB1 bacterium]|nr:YigZ family protein [candidate division KSB1 bacterium]